jgi:glutamate 5-kinase
MSVLVAKLGTSTLVDEAGEVRQEVLEDRVREIVRVRRQGHRPVLVSSGATACGIRVLGAPGRVPTLADLQAASAVGQGLLFARYAEAFAAHDVTPAQVLLTSPDLERRASYVNARTALGRLLDLGCVPVVNENDTTATDGLTFGDNDVLAAQVAILLRAAWLVLLTDREGLYAPGPEGPRLIGDVPAGARPTDLDLAPLETVGPGRGGVASKVASASMATAAGITCIVASGRAEGVITAVAHGHHVGTRFQPAPRAESAFKLWLRHAKPSMGTVRVDAGAAEALERRGTSLLPVGVVSCEGAFAAGDAVEVRTAEGGRLVGKGIAAVSADELRQIAGLKSREARRRLPEAAEEVVHRDQFVLA